MDTDNDDDDGYDDDDDDLALRARTAFLIFLLVVASVFGGLALGFIADWIQGRL